jgi:hypothetical protein
MVAHTDAEFRGTTNAPYSRFRTDRRQYTGIAPDGEYVGGRAG